MVSGGIMEGDCTVEQAHKEVVIASKDKRKGKRIFLSLDFQINEIRVYGNLLFCIRGHTLN